MGFRSVQFFAFSKLHTKYVMLSIAFLDVSASFFLFKAAEWPVPLACLINVDVL